MELTSETEETTVRKLEDEIKECKGILKCGVCFDRPKEVTYNVLYVFLNHDFRGLHHSQLHHEVPVSLLDDQFCRLN